MLKTIFTYKGREYGYKIVNGEIVNILINSDVLKELSLIVEEVMNMNLENKDDDK